MLNHRIRGLLFKYKKTRYFAIGFNFFGKTQFGNSENDVNSEQNLG